MDHTSESCDKLIDGDISTTFSQWSNFYTEGAKTITLKLCNPAVISAYEWVNADETDNDPITWTLEAKEMNTDEWVLLHEFNPIFRTEQVTTDRRSIVGPFNVEAKTKPACVESNTCLLCPVDSNSRRGSAAITQCVCHAGFTLDIPHLTR